MELSEKDLIEFINKFRGRVFRTCLGFVQNTDDANDLTQEVFLAVLESLDDFRNEAQLSTWVYRIAVNKSLNHLKKKKRRNIFQNIDKLLFKSGQGEAHQYVHNPVDDDESSKEVAFLLSHALSKLPESQRVAFTLSKYDELSNPEVASVMGNSVSAVESLLHRAKQNMQKTLREHKF
jgi:RNA polymerase sigma-70 factor (ECF subfamily)